MVFNKNKSGQAAIEFLMTYGWMLLIVLIVGALIFSFVDFGSLLPNKVELNNNILSKQSESFARFTTGAAAATSHVVVTFVYQGSDRVTISDQDDDSKIASDLDGDCNLTWVKNADTQESSNASDSISGLTGTATSPLNGPITFIQSQTGIAVYDCSENQGSYNNNGGFRDNDVLEGTITLIFRNAKTDVPIPSSGPIRLGITN